MAIGRIANVDGVKTVILGDRLVSRDYLNKVVASLNDRITVQLPQARAGLDAKKLLEQAQGAIDRQVSQLAAQKTELADLLAAFDKA